MNPRITDIVEWLRRRVNAAAARGLVVGVSGGVDSAVVAAALSDGDAGTGRLP